MKICKYCKHSVDYGESVEYIACERKKRKKYIKKTDTCKNYEEKNKMYQEYLNSILDPRDWIEIWLR